MNKSDSWNIKRIIVIIILAAAIIAAAFGFLNYFIITQENAIYEDRKDNQIHSAEKASTIVETTRNSIWPDLDSVEYMLQEYPFDTKGSIYEALKAIAESRQFPNTKIMLINQDADYFCSDGNSGYFDDVDFLMKALDGKASTVGFVPHLGQTQSFLLSTKPVDIQTPLGHVEFIVYCADARVLAQQLQGSVFNDESETLIIEENGSRIFDTKKDSVLTGFNIFNELKNHSFTKKGAYDSFISNVKAGNPDAVEFDAGDGQKYFISSSEHVDGWIVLEVVPSDTISSKLAYFMNQTTRSLTFVFLFVIAVIFVAVFLFIRGRNEKVRREKEEMANEALKKIAETERAASEAKSDFLSNMSHDIRTPINGIMGMTTIALKDPGDTSRVEDCLHKIEGASSHLLSLVNDVLDMSRIERKKTVIAHDPIDIRTVLSVRCVT